MQDSQYEILDAALNVMVIGTHPAARRPWQRRPRSPASTARWTAPISSRACSRRPPDDPVRNLLRTALVSWDYAEAPDWAVGTLRNTRPSLRDLVKRGCWC